jgi:hypothetical protein
MDSVAVRTEDSEEDIAVEVVVAVGERERTEDFDTVIPV